MASSGRKRRAGRNRFWAAMNSPLALLLISGVVIAGGAKLYSDHQVAAADLEARRAAYVELLAEYQRRVSLLMQADGELNPFIGEGTTLVGAERLPDSGPRRRQWERISTEVGRREMHILRGTGDYVPTSPSFASVDILTIAARMERVAGIPDIQLGGLRLIRTLDAPPDVLWLFVRAHLPVMLQFGVVRHMMYTNGTIPLVRGGGLTEQQEAALGFPRLKPGDLEKAMQDSNRMHARIQAELRETENSLR